MEKFFIRHRSNDITSGVLHLVGAALAIGAIVVLIVLGALRGNAWHVVGYSLYGFGLILLYIMSATYHLAPQNAPRFKSVAQHLDHAVIYILIAATYTPITFIVFSGTWRWTLFGTIWALAVIGAISRLLWLRFPMFLATIFYLIIGWLIIVAISPLIENMAPAPFWILVSGGISYTVGAGFFALEYILPKKKYFWMHEIFHIFTIGGSVLHTIVMFLIL